MWVAQGEEGLGAGVEAKQQPDDAGVARNQGPSYQPSKGAKKSSRLNKKLLGWTPPGDGCLRLKKSPGEDARLVQGRQVALLWCRESRGGNAALAQINSVKLLHRPIACTNPHTIRSCLLSGPKCIHLKIHKPKNHLQIKKPSGVAALLRLCKKWAENPTY